MPGNRQPVTNTDPTFGLALQFALEEATRRQKTHLDGMLGFAAGDAGQEPGTNRPSKRSSGMDLQVFLQMIDDNVDYLPEQLWPRALRTQLDAFGKSFTEAFSQQQNLKDLLTELEAFVAKEHAQLFYQTNDLVSASIHYDHFQDFTDALCLKLGEQGTLNHETLDRIEALEKAYKLGLDAYRLTSKKLAQWTLGETRSILEEAERYQREAAQAEEGADADVALESLENSAHMVVRGLLFKNYGLQPTEQAPPPLLMLLAHETEKLAKSHLQAEKPHIDFQSPDPASNDAVGDRFVELWEELTTRLGENPSLLQYSHEYQSLKKQVAEAQNIPENFSKLVEKAINAAEKATLEKIPELQRDHRAMLPTPTARVQKIWGIINPSHETAQELKLHSEAFCYQMRRAVTCEDKDELMDCTEHALDSLSRQLAIYGIHPAMALFAEEYLAEFRAQLGQALSQANRHDLRFSGALKELETKAGYIHENQRALEHWCMQDSDGGHSSYYQWAFVNVAPASMPPTEEDVRRFAEWAAAEIIQSAENRGIVPSLAHVPYVPLIYARCHDIAQAKFAQEVERQFIKEDKDIHFQKTPEVIEKRKTVRSWTNRVCGVGRSIEPYDQNYDREELPEFVRKSYKTIHAHTLSLFYQAMSSLLPAEAQQDLSKILKQKAPQKRDQKISEFFDEHPIELTAHNLRATMEFLDRISQEKSLTLH